MDALIPAYNEYEKHTKTESWQIALAAAVKKAEEGCESTRIMEAKYVNLISCMLFKLIIKDKNTIINVIDTSIIRLRLCLAK